MGGIFSGGGMMVQAGMNLVTAILVVAASSLLAWGGYKGAKRRKRRKARDYEEAGD